MPHTLTIGAHDVGLARAQAEWLASLLRERHPNLAVDLELINVKMLESPLHDDHVAENRTAQGALHDALREGEVDIVVHSAFDLRDRLPQDMKLAAVPLRRSPYDSLLCTDGRILDELDEGERVGVVQLRARAQLMGHRPDLEYPIIQGDVGQWLTALLDGEIEALIAPNAALELLGLQERVTELFPPEMLMPAPGSGLLVCLCRQDDKATGKLLAEIHDKAAADEYQAEISFVRALGEDWERPVAALAQRARGGLALMGLVTSPDGASVLRKGIQTDEHGPQELGETLAELLLDAGARRILDEDEDGPAVDDIAGAIASEAEWAEEDFED